MSPCGLSSPLVLLRPPTPLSPSQPPPLTGSTDACTSPPTSTRSSTSADVTSSPCLTPGRRGTRPTIPALAGQPTLLVATFAATVRTRPVSRHAFDLVRPAAHVDLLPLLLLRRVLQVVLVPDKALGALTLETFLPGERQGQSQDEGKGKCYCRVRVSFREPCDSGYRTREGGSQHALL